MKLQKWNTQLMSTQNLYFCQRDNLSRQRLQFQRNFRSRPISGSEKNKKMCLLINLDLYILTRVILKIWPSLKFIWAFSSIFYKRKIFSKSEKNRITFLDGTRMSWWERGSAQSRWTEPRWCTPGGRSRACSEPDPQTFCLLCLWNKQQINKYFFFSYYGLNFL